MFLMVLACLLSVPALSSENPWDADGSSGGGTSTPVDSTEDNETTILSSQPQINPSALPSTNDKESWWFSRFAMRVSAYFLSAFSSGTQKKERIDRPAY